MSTESFNTLLLEHLESVTYVRLNRPSLHNAFNEEMIREITECFHTLSRNATTRIVILTGEGESFSAGADLHWMKKMAQYSEEENLRDSQKLHAMFESIYTCSKPVIASVNGPAYGGGVGLIAAADIAIADEKATFALSEVRLGLIPAVISPFVLKKIGETNAREFFLTAERFNARTAQSIGLVREVLPTEKIQEKIQEKIKLLQMGGPHALSQTKKLIETVANQPIEKIKDFTCEQIAKRRVSQEGQEGIQAFLEKRKPKWTFSGPIK